MYIYSSCIVFQEQPAHLEGEESYKISIISHNCFFPPCCCFKLACLVVPISHALLCNLSFLVAFYFLP